MDEGTYDGVQDSGDGKDDCNKVQGHRKGHVQFDGSHHALGKSNEMGKLFYFIVYKGNVGCVYCDVASPRRPWQFPLLHASEPGRR